METVHGKVVWDGTGKLLEVEPVIEGTLLSHVLFPTYVAALLWGGLLLRDPRLRAFLPLRRTS